MTFGPINEGDLIGDDLFGVRWDALWPRYRYIIVYLRVPWWTRATHRDFNVLHRTWTGWCKRWFVLRFNDREHPLRLETFLSEN